MANQPFDSDYIDRYLRNDLSADEEAAFETALLDSPDLQDDLEAAMAVCQVLHLEEESESSVNEEPLDYLQRKNNWQPFAMAASVLLAVFSTVMFWKISNDSAGLQRQIDALNQPHADVSTVSLDIMRSSGDTPGVVIQKPAANALVLLDIELGPKGQQKDSILMTMRDESHAEILHWTSTVRGQRRVSMAITSDQLPDGQVWLEMSDSQGEIFERRLIEFLPSERP